MILGKSWLSFWQLFLICQVGNFLSLVTLISIVLSLENQWSKQCATYRFTIFLAAFFQGERDSLFKIPAHKTFLVYPLNRNDENSSMWTTLDLGSKIS